MKNGFTKEIVFVPFIFLIVQPPAFLEIFQGDLDVFFIKEIHYHPPGDAGELAGRLAVCYIVLPFSSTAKQTNIIERIFKVQVIKGI